MLAKNEQFYVVSDNFSPDLIGAANNNNLKDADIYLQAIYCGHSGKQFQVYIFESATERSDRRTVIVNSFSCV